MEHFEFEENDEVLDENNRNKHQKKCGIHIDYKDIQYFVDIRCRLSDLRILNSKEDQYEEECMRKLVLSHLAADDLVKSQIQIESKVLMQYILASIEYDDEIRREFENSTDENVYRRYIFALEKKLLNSIDFSTIDITSGVIEKFNEITQNLNENMAELISNMAELISNMGSRISKLTENIAAYVTRQVEEFVQLLEETELSEEEQEKLISSYRMWGKLGWTVPPDAPINIFNEEPKDAVEGYQRLRPYLEKENIEELFEKLRSFEKVKKADIEEAISCYQAKQYKACTLIVFSMIDSKLIRAQRKEDRNKRDRRPVGRRAAKNLFDRLSKQEKEQELLIVVLHRINTLEAIVTFFGDADDFKKQPTIVNRNFVTHGMLYRKVTRKDCIMLFLLLYNFIQVREFYL